LARLADDLVYDDSGEVIHAALAAVHLFLTWLTAPLDKSFPIPSAGYYSTKVPVSTVPFLCVRFILSLQTEALKAQASLTGLLLDLLIFLHHVSNPLSAALLSNCQCSN
jgi:hypothetical protein